MKKVLVILAMAGAGLVYGGSPNKVETVLGEIATAEKKGQTWEISEGDLNLYLEQQLRTHNQEGVKAASVDLREGSFFLRLDVEADKVDLGGQSAAAMVVSALFKGTQRVEVEGRLKAENGTGSYETTGAWINSITVPVAVVDALLVEIGKSAEPPFDPSEPFALPAGLQEITLVTDKAILKN